MYRPFGLVQFPTVLAICRIRQAKNTFSHYTGGRLVWWRFAPEALPNRWEKGAVKSSATWYFRVLFPYNPACPTREQQLIPSSSENLRAFTDNDINPFFASTVSDAASHTGRLDDGENKLLSIFPKHFQMCEISKHLASVPGCPERLYLSRKKRREKKALYKEKTKRMGDKPLDDK